MRSLVCLAVVAWFLFVASAVLVALLIVCAMLRVPITGGWV